MKERNLIQTWQHPLPTETTSRLSLQSVVFTRRPSFNSPHSQLPLNSSIFPVLNIWHIMQRGRIRSVCQSAQEPTEGASVERDWTDLPALHTRGPIRFGLRWLSDTLAQALCLVFLRAFWSLYTTRTGGFSNFVAAPKKWSDGWIVSTAGLFRLKLLV